MERVDNPKEDGQNPTNLLPISHPRFMNTVCKHPVVKIVSRDEDAEFVECQACGEIFDSNEFRDMAIEEEVEAEAEEES